MYFQLYRHMQRYNQSAHNKPQQYRYYRREFRPRRYYLQHQRHDPRSKRRRRSQCVSKILPDRTGRDPERLAWC